MLGLKDCFQSLEKIEIEKNLFEKKIDNIYFWKVIRFEVLLKILEKTKLLNEIKNKNSNSKIRLLKNLFNNLFRNNRKKKEIIIFEAGRFFLEEEKYKNIYTFNLIKELEEKNIAYEILYPEFTEDKVKNKNTYRVENFNYIFLKIIYLLKRKLKKLSLEEKSFLRKLKKELEDKFEIGEIGILKERNIINRLYSFKMLYKYYSNYFKKKSPKQIYIICSYGKEAIIKAAQDLGIEIIELQHGVFSKYHIGYSFPKVKIPYFPDKFFLFGEYWKENEFLPFNTEKKIYGYSYLYNQMEKYKNIKRNKKQVIFISQWIIGKRLSLKAIEFAKENPDIKVIYRLHPGEFSIWKIEYKELYENRELKNLEISDNNERNLYEYLLESEYLIGVYSTVIYEALEVGVKIGIIKLLGYEYLEDLIEQNIIYAFEEKEKISLSKLEHLKKIDREYLFKK